MGKTDSERRQLEIRIVVSMGIDCINLGGRRNWLQLFDTRELQALSLFIQTAQHMTGRITAASGGQGPNFLLTCILDGGPKRKTQQVLNDAYLRSLYRARWQMANWFGMETSSPASTPICQCFVLVQNIDFSPLLLESRLRPLERRDETFILIKRPCPSIK